MASLLISSTVQATLAAAAERPNHLVILPDRLPVAAQRAVVQSMLKAGFIEEIAAGDGQPAWRKAESGESLGLRATRAGLDAVRSSRADDGPPAVLQVEGGHKGVPTPDPTSDGVTAEAALDSPRVRLRAAVEAVLLAWNDAAEGYPALPDALDALRAAVTTGQRVAGTSRTPRTGTKQEAVLTLLRRPEGATVAQVAEATSWASHTVRGFFAGLKKKNIMVDVLERVRQVGSGKQGAKGSYTVYRVEEVG